MVTTAGKLSGIAATAIAIVVSNASIILWLERTKTFTINIVTAIIITIMLKILPRLANFFCIGVVSGLLWVNICAMCPSSVFIAVATTTHNALPKVTLLPLNTILVLSPSAVFLGKPSLTNFCTG